MKLIEKKIESKYFDQINEWEKSFEIRKEDDTTYCKGDIVCLKEISNDLKIGYTGLMQFVRITNVWRDLPGLKDGYCIFSFERMGGVCHE